MLTTGLALMLLAAPQEVPQEAPLPNCCERPVPTAVQPVPVATLETALTVALDHICVLTPWTTDFDPDQRIAAARHGFVEDAWLFSTEVEGIAVTVLPENAESPCRIETTVPATRTLAVHETLGDWAQARGLRQHLRDRHGPVDGRDWDGPWFTQWTRGTEAYGVLDVRMIEATRQDETSDRPTTIQWSRPTGEGPSAP